MMLHRPEIGEGTGQGIEVLVRVLVGTEACKVIVEQRGEPARVRVVPHREAARTAGRAVEEIVAGHLSRGSHIES
jgi:hypothetical protein